MLETSSQSKQTPQEKEFFNNNTATSNNSPTRCRGNGLAHCDLDSPVKKQLKLSNTCEEKKRRERELNSAPDPVSDLGSSPHVEQEEVEQENCAPAPDTGMSSCEGPHTAGACPLSILSWLFPGLVKSRRAEKLCCVVCCGTIPMYL